MENKKIFIGNLDFAATKEEVKALLSDYGTVVIITLHKKKGYAFVEMSSEAEAALAIEKLTGVTFKDREIRISPEIKARKAKTLTIKSHNERANRFSKKKKTAAHPQWSHDRQPRQKRPPHSGRTSGHDGYPEDEINYNTEERWAETGQGPAKNYSRGRFDAPHPQRKEWSPDRSLHRNRPPRGGRASGHGVYRDDEINYNTRERWADSENRPRKNYSRGRSDAPHPQRKEWSHDGPLRQNRTPRDGRKTGHGRSQQPETNYNTRERWSDSEERPRRNYGRGRSDAPHPQRKEWSHDKSSYAGRPSGPSRKPGAGARDGSKPRQSGPSPKRFTASSGPGGKGKSANAGRPKSRGGAGNKGRGPRVKRD